MDPQSFDSAASLLPLALPLLVPIAVLFIPFVDLVMAVVRRTRRGQSPFSPDKMHLHHRLLSIGHSHRRAVLVMYFWAALLSFGAVGAVDHRRAGGAARRHRRPAGGRRRRRPQPAGPPGGAGRRGPAELAAQRAAQPGRAPHRPAAPRRTAAGRPPARPARLRAGAAAPPGAGQVLR